MILPGFIFALVAGLLMAFGLAAVGGGGRSFARHRRGWSCSSRSASPSGNISATPVFNHFGWRYWIYAFTAESVSLILAGLVIARWFLPRARRGGRAAAPAEAPPATERPRARRGSARRRRSRGGDRRAPPRLPHPRPIARPATARRASRRPRPDRAQIAPSASARAMTSEPEMVTRGDRPASANGSRAATAAREPRERLGRLRHVDDAERELEHDVVALLRPGEDRVPELRLARGQRRRPFGAVAEQVGSRHKRRGRARTPPASGRDPVDRGVGEAGQRHRARVDRLALRVPFVGDRFGERVGRRRERRGARASSPAGRRAGCARPRRRAADSCRSASRLGRRPPLARQIFGPEEAGDEADDRDREADDEPPCDEARRSARAAGRAGTTTVPPMRTRLIRMKRLRHMALLAVRGSWSRLPSARISAAIAGSNGASPSAAPIRSAVRLCWPSLRVPRSVLDRQLVADDRLQHRLEPAGRHLGARPGGLGREPRLVRGAEIVEQARPAPPRPAGAAALPPRRAR